MTKIVGGLGFIFPIVSLLAVLSGCGGGGGSSLEKLNLSVTAVSPSQVNLSWSAPSDAVSGYFIYRDGVQIDYMNAAIGTSDVDRTVNPLTKYCYTVYASWFAVGDIAQSNTVCVKTPGTASGWNISNLFYSRTNPSAAIDKANKLHISGSGSTTTGSIEYATNASGNWVVSTVDSGGGWFSSIAIDSGNKVHITYYDAITGDLKYATNASGSWVISTIDSGEVTHTSIAVDSMNHVHIGYSVWPAEYRYATNASGSWTKTLVSGFSDGQSGAPSIAIDSKNSVHFIFTLQGAATGYLYYMNNASGAWTETVMDSGVIAAGKSSMVIDSSDNVHISYWRSAPYALIYATNTSGTWTKVPVDSSDWFGEDTSIAVDKTKGVHISYADSNWDLKYATNVTGNWTTYYVDSIGVVGAHNAIVVDSGGKPQIIYHDVTNYTIKLVSKM